MSNKTLRLSALADLIGARLTGDGSIEINAISPLQVAKSGQISFLDNPRYRKHLDETEASAVILTERYAKYSPVPTLVVAEPYVAFAKLTEYFAQIPQPAVGIHPSAVIAENCEIPESAIIDANVVVGRGSRIGENVIVGAGSVIGENVSIGDDTRLWPNVTLYYGVQIGKSCLFHSGVVIGADGFGLAKDNSEWRKIAQLGTVIIGDKVEVGANTTIDRGALGNTIIGNGSKLDNLVQLGHNVEIGEHTAIAGCVAVAGSTKVGSHCLIGGGSCISGHIEITDNVALYGMSGVAQSVNQQGLYASATLIQDARAWKKTNKHLREIDSLVKRVRELEQLLATNTEEKQS